jgi:hypothetical protein
LNFLYLFIKEVIFYGNINNLNKNKLYIILKFAKLYSQKISYDFFNVIKTKIIFGDIINLIIKY